MTTPQSFQSYSARLIGLIRADLRKTFVDATSLASGNLELSGTGLRNFVAWMEAHENGGAIKFFFDDGKGDAIRALNAIDEQAGAIEVLLRSEPTRLTPATTLLRGAMEGVIHLCYLFDSAVPPAQMAARQVAYRVAALQGNEKALIAFGSDAPPEALVQAKDATDNIKKIFEMSGFELNSTKAGGRYTPSVSIQGETAQVKVNMTAAVRKYVPDDTFGWAIASGAVHSEGWFLPSFVDGVDEPALGDLDENTTAIVGSLIDAAEALGRAIGEHTGFDVVPLQKRLFTRQKALLSRLRGTPFSSIDRETYQARGKSTERTHPEATLGRSFVRPGTTYGTH